MRWWPWGDRSEREVPAPAPAVEPTPPPPADAWRSLPPTRATVSEHRPVFKTLDFGDDLRSWHSPTFVRELRHELSPTGPIGVMSGIATTVPATSVARTIAPDAADRPVRDFHALRPRRLPSVQRSAFGGTIATSGPNPFDLVSSPAPIHDPFVVPSVRPSGAEGTVHASDLVAPPLDDVALLGERETATVLDPPPQVSAAPPTPEIEDLSVDPPRPPVRLGLGAPLPSRPIDRPQDPPDRPAPPTDSGPLGLGPVTPPGSASSPPALAGPAPVADGSSVETRDVPLLGGAPPPTVLGPDGPAPTASRSPLERGGDAPPVVRASPSGPSPHGVQREVDRGPTPVNPTVVPNAEPPPVGLAPAAPIGPSPSTPVEPPAARSDVGPAPEANDAAPPPAPVEPTQPVTAPDPDSTEPTAILSLLGDRPLERGIDGLLGVDPPADPPSGSVPGVDPVVISPLARVQRSIDQPAATSATGSSPAGLDGAGAAGPSPAERREAPPVAQRSSVAVLARRPIDPVLTGSGMVAGANGPTGSSEGSAGDASPPVGGSALGAVQRHVIAEPAEPEARAVFDPIPVAPTAVEPLARNVPRQSAGASPVVVDGGVRPPGASAAIPARSGSTARSAAPVFGGMGPIAVGAVQRSAAGEVRSGRVTTPRWPVPDALAPLPAEASWEGREVAAAAQVGAEDRMGGGGGRWVQREDDGGEPQPSADPAPTPAAPTATVSVGGPTAASTGSGLIGSDDQIDQLAKRLYPRIRDRIRIEARLDRERSGRALDVQR